MSEDPIPLTAEPLSDQIFHQFLTLLHAQRQYARQIETEQNIKPRDFSVLRFLLESGSATISEIGAYLHSSASTTSILITQLETSGYVSRNRSAEDNRVVIVSLTPAGQEIAEKAPFGGLPLLRRRLRQLSEERLAEISSVVVELRQLMGTEENA